MWEYTHIDCWRICGGRHRWDYDDYDVERERDRLDFPCKYNMHIYSWACTWSVTSVRERKNSIHRGEWGGGFKPLKKYDDGKALSYRWVLLVNLERDE